MKYWLILVLALVLTAGCDIPDVPTGKSAETPAAQTSTPTNPSVNPIPDTPTVQSPSTAEELGIKIQTGTLSFKSPELKEGQWAKYKITTLKGGETQTFERSYSIISFFYNRNPCLGIERNSTRPGETRTRTMWCDDSKVVFTWSEKKSDFTPQNLGKAYWSSEAIQGMETKVSGLHEIDVAAGKFWTLKRESWDGVTKKTWHGSPLVPGFEAGLVKKVETSNSETITTELVAASH